MSSKVAVITGASKGIGRETVKILAGMDYYVVLLGRDIEALKSVLKKISDDKVQGECYNVDMRDHKSVADIIEKVATDHEKIDLLVNCAGAGCFGKVTDVDTEDFVSCLDVNINAVFNITKCVAKIMKCQNCGQIINISSIAGEKGFAYGSAYVSSKFALEGFTQVLWEELKRHEIRVCTIKPGLVNTGFYDGMKLSDDDAGRMLYAPGPEDIAKVVGFVVSQPESVNISEIVLRPVRRQAQDLFSRILNENYENV